MRRAQRHGPMHWATEWGANGSDSRSQEPGDFHGYRPRMCERPHLEVLEHLQTPSPEERNAEGAGVEWSKGDGRLEQPS